ncbi:hypothetical protein ACFO5X_06475 [Seohaeicola nanhaiensis]|uniref:DUF1444 family protein n=1 Tax=Seohaeicola nanhaiensis TaxID=1387282 RepID=A0ABV9KDL0_9RHOB
MADTLRIMAEAFAPFGAVRLDEAAEAIVVTREGQEETVFFAQNLHGMLQRAETGAERDQILDDFLAGYSESHDARRDNLMIAVRHRDYAAFVPTPAPVWALAGDLVVFVMVDNARSLAVASDEALAELNLTEDQAYDLGAAHLARMAVEAGQEGEDILMLTLPDASYVSSLMALPSFWVPYQIRFSRVVVSPLARDVLLVVDGARPEMVAELRALGERHWDRMDYPLTRNLFVLGPDG